MFERDAELDENEGFALPAIFDDWVRRSEIRKALRNQKVLESKTDFISDNAFLCWSQGDLRYFLVERPGREEHERMRAVPELARTLAILERMGRYNGYVRFPRLPVVAPGYGGILPRHLWRESVFACVKVEGGTTYHEARAYTRGNGGRVMWLPQEEGFGREGGVWEAKMIPDWWEIPEDDPNLKRITIFGRGIIEAMKNL